VIIITKTNNLMPRF